MHLKTASNSLRTSKPSRKPRWHASLKRGEIKSLLMRKIAPLLQKSWKMHRQHLLMMLKSKVLAACSNSENSKRKKRPRYCFVKLKSLVWITNSQSTLTSVISKTRNPASSSQSGLKTIRQGPIQPSRSPSILWQKSEVKFTLRNSSSSKSRRGIRKTFIAHSNQNCSISRNPGLHSSSLLTLKHSRLPKRRWLPPALRWTFQMEWQWA